MRSSGERGKDATCEGSGTITITLTTKIVAGIVVRLFAQNGPGVVTTETVFPQGPCSNLSPVHHISPNCDPEPCSHTCMWFKYGVYGSSSQLCSLHNALLHSFEIPQMAAPSYSQFRRNGQHRRCSNPPTSCSGRINYTSLSLKFRPT